MRLKTILIIIPIIFSGWGCGYFENDHIENLIDVNGNIKILKQQNNQVNDLVYQETNEFFSVIVENCKLVYYDSVAKMIFCESIINQYNSKYYQIDITDSKTRNLAAGIKKQTIDENTFLNKTKHINRKWEFYAPTDNQ